MTLDGGMITEHPFQMGTRAQHKKNELYKVSGNLCSCQANMMVISKETVSMPHIALRYWMNCCWEQECLEKNPTMDALSFATILTDCLVVFLTFKMMSF